MKIAPSRRTDYGIRALIHLAQHAGTTSRADDIGAAMEIPTGFLRQILQSLQRARLVVSQPGPNGGYALARRASDVTILEVVEALEGSLTEGECALRGGPCHWDDVCALHWTWSAARRAFSDELAKGEPPPDDPRGEDLHAGVARCSTCSARGSCSTSSARAS